MSATDAIDANAVRDALLRLIACETPLTAQREADPAIQAFLRDTLPAELHRIGVDDHAWDTSGNLLARLPADGRSSTLLFVVYAMTHPAGTMNDAFAPRCLDGARFGTSGPVVRGRAACEQRGSLAAVLAALDQLRRQPGEHAEILVLALASGETGTHDAARGAIDEFRIAADGAIVAVCSDKRITVAHKGRVDVRVTVTGKAAHASAPQLGVNAVHGARWVLDRLDRVDLGSPHPELGPATLAVTRVWSEPVAPHTIPSRCFIDLDLRLLPGQDPDAQVDRLRAVLSDAPRQPPLLRAGHAMLPCELRRDAPIVSAIRAASQAATGTVPALQVMSAASDMGFLNHAGIDTVVYGAGSVALAHTDDEYVAVDDVVDVAAVYAALMRAGCPGGSS